MKKFLILAFVMLLSITFASAQSKSSKKIKTQSAMFVTQVDGFNLIWYDTKGQMDLHETMLKINPEHDPELTIIKDEDLGIWRLAVTLEEAALMPDKMKVVRDRYKNVIPYKRTGYID